MFPILFESGPIIVPAWHAFFVLGALGSYFLLHRLNTTSETNQARARDLDGLYLATYLGGLLGARILNIFVLEDYASTSEFLSLSFSLGGMTFFGGMILGGLSGLLYSRIKKLDSSQLFDIGSVALFLGVGVGRIGCFLNGDDYGVPLANQNASSWWGVVFPNLEDNLKRYPTQLFEAGACLLMVFILSVFFNRIRSRFFVGAVGVLAMSGYAISRFCLEYFRGDDRGYLITDVLSTSQFLSVCTLVLMALIAKQRLQTQPS
ncbi:MAG: prolipoprotein diacylglyceryl transferase [Oligoflexales bacterium]